MELWFKHSDLDVKNLAYFFQKFSDLVDDAEDCLLTFF